jgi:hypothetical protein
MTIDQERDDRIDPDREIADEPPAEPPVPMPDEDPKTDEVPE